MQWFLDLKISRRRSIELWFSVVVCLVIGGLSISGIRSVATANDQVQARVTMPLADLAVIGQLQERRRINVRDVIMATTPEQTKRYQDRCTAIEHQVDSLSAVFKATLVTGARSRVCCRRTDAPGLG